MEPTTTNSLEPIAQRVETKRVRYARKPDAQGFDEIRLVTVPRFKSSYLSGDEWRIHVSLQFCRKGRIVHEEFGGHKMDTAVQMLGQKYLRAGDDGKMFFGGGENGTCDQEGCAEQAKVFYRKKLEYCNEPYKHEPIPLDEETVIRGFCERHSKRGDSSFDDMDSNYELVDGSVVPPRKEDVSESILGGVINAGELSHPNTEQK